MGRDGIQDINDYNGGFDWNGNNYQSTYPGF